MRRSGIRYTVGMATSVTGFLDVKVDGVSYKESDRLPNRSGKLYPSASDRIFLTQAYYDRCRLLGYLTGSGGSDHWYGGSGTDNGYKSCTADDLGEAVHDGETGHGYSRKSPGPPFGGPPTVVTPLFTDADTTLFMSIAGLYYSSGLPSFVEDGFSIRSGLGGSEAEYDPSTHAWTGDAVEDWARATTDAAALKSVFTGNRLCELSDAPHGSDPEGGGNVGYGHIVNASVAGYPVAPCLDEFVFRRSRVAEAYENLSRLNRAAVRLAVIGNTQFFGYSVKDGSTTSSASGSVALVTDGSPADVSVYPSCSPVAGSDVLSPGLLSKPVAVLIVVVTRTSATLHYEFSYRKGTSTATRKLSADATKGSVVAYRPDMGSFGKLAVTMSGLGLSIPTDHEAFPLAADWVSESMEAYKARTFDFPDLVWKWSDPELADVSVNASAGDAYAVVEFNSDCRTNVDAQGNLK